jgi:ABC-2 type transport system permease protein
MSWTRVRAMARKEWTQLRRDSRSLLLSFGLPLFLLVFFGYAIKLDVDDIELAVLDESRTSESRELIETFEASGYFTVVEYVEAPRDVEERLMRSRALGVLVVPPTFRSDLARGRASVQMVVDGSDANTATIALNYAEAMVAGYSRRVVLRGRRVSQPVSPEARIWYNPTLESKNMIVPALVAVIMAIIAALLTALTIAREWERGSMEQLVATPVSRSEVIMGKLIPYVLIGLVDVAATVLAGALLFQAPLRGSLVLLGGLTLLFLVGALGFGIFISAAVKSQVFATQIALITSLLPSVLLSGFLFDIAGMPLVLQGVSYLVPARYFIVVTRGIFLKGVGLSVLWPEALLMIAYAVLGLLLARRFFKKEIG